MKLSVSKDLTPFRQAAHDKINAERDNIINTGTAFTVVGVGDIPLVGTDGEMIRLLGLKDTARDLKVAGITDALIPYKDASNTERMYTADQMISLVGQGKKWVTDIYKKSWVAKNAVDAAADPAAIDAATNVDWTVV